MISLCSSQTSARGRGQGSLWESRVFARDARACLLTRRHVAPRPSSTSDTNRRVLVCFSHTATGTLHSRSLTPDDDVFQHLAHTYASRNPTMKKGDHCKNKMNFPNGITNGYSWYPLKGKFLFSSLLALSLVPSSTAASWLWLTPEVVSLLGTVPSFQSCSVS